MSIEIEGLEQFAGEVAKVDKIAHEFATEFLRRVKQKTPVDTGRLQASWTMEVEDTSITVKNEAENDRGEPYSVYVEFGTEHTHPVMMLSRTIDESPEILETAKRAAGL